MSLKQLSRSNDLGVRLTTATRWTNDSVLRFAGDEDPVAAITEHARTVVAQAMDAGWVGPPFDPLGVADFLRLDVVPSADVLDARTVPTTREGARIEFNPNRPRGRLRYSLAHEIAHTFFPDCTERVRNRGGHEKLCGDEWQLEALCNIGAAELLMPFGSLPPLKASSLTVDALMNLRLEYQVSTEAMFIRAVSLSDEPCAMFCAHRIESGANSGRYRLDYLISSKAWRLSSPSRGLLPQDSVAAECTAIGWTAKRDESLWDSYRVHIECVGVPPYPGSSHPRVVGLVLPVEPGTLREPSIEYLKGSVLEPRGSGQRIIAHVVNNRTLNWGGHGVASAMKRKWPSLQADYNEWGRQRKLSRALGEVCFSRVETDLTVASMVAQVGYGDSAAPRLRYAALRSCLAQVLHHANKSRASLHIPRVGCGQAGGNWDVVRDLIASTFSTANIPVTVYDPPGFEQPVSPQAGLPFGTD